jgi:hypothetical protein
MMRAESSAQGDAEHEQKRPGRNCSGLSACKALSLSPAANGEIQMRVISKAERAERRDSEGMREIEIINMDHTPSWKRKHDVVCGFSSLRLQQYASNGNLELRATEYGELEGSRKATAKEVMFGISEESARALYRFLAERFASEGR